MDAYEEGIVLRRSFTVTTFGDTADEIETAALFAAQEFFGDGVPLQVVLDYVVSSTVQFGKKHVATITVRALA